MATEEERHTWAVSAAAADVEHAQRHDMREALSREMFGKKLSKLTSGEKDVLKKEFNKRHPSEFLIELEKVKQDTADALARIRQSWKPFDDD